jgi:hypothetical protein
VLWAAEQRLGVKLPVALREAYLLFGRRADLTACQDPLLPPDRLRVDHSGSIMVFRVENQHCAEWGVATGDDWNQADPPVYVRQRDDRRWEPFLDRVPAACVEMVLSEVLLGRRQLGDMCALPAGLRTDPVSGMPGRLCQGVQGPLRPISSSCRLPASLCFMHYLE